MKTDTLIIGGKTFHFLDAARMNLATDSGAVVSAAKGTGCPRPEQYRRITATDQDQWRPIVMNTE
ncbi:hypothetical protein NOR51B_2501 [Luminiphilus syltensis NOR5-1B]|uniref:Uncharacterized protein n=1 Tax=Luminiphilus syltensis NOR5-1B TaxID=565045 RepID=B8KRZ4_9GAMM|nr:hypothetical protein [Luminiphilus syltensis]EED36549.1 hypothetical protein NOR51B_2501 [Luminiphilus syltensis NOR5-1B]